MCFSRRGLVPKTPCGTEESMSTEKYSERGLRSFLFLRDGTTDDSIGNRADAAESRNTGTVRIPDDE